MGVAEGKDLEGARVQGDHQEVLDQTRHHVPGVEVQDQHQRVQPVRQQQQHHDQHHHVRQRPVVHAEADDGADDEVEPHDQRVEGTHRQQNDQRLEYVLQRLGPVADTDDEHQRQRTDTQHVEDGEDPVASTPDGGVQRERPGEEVECQVEVQQREEQEDKQHKLVEKLDLEEELAEVGVVGVPDTGVVAQRVEGGKEGPVHPPPPLQEKFRHQLGNIGLTGGQFDKLKHPVLPLLRHKLPAEDPVLGQVHVCLKEVGLGVARDVGQQQVFTFKVRVQGASAVGVVAEGNVAVGGEGTGQHRDVPEHQL